MDDRSVSLEASAPDEGGEELRRALAASMLQARRVTDGLFSLITPEGLTSRPIAERHRLIFYLGHLEAFEWNVLCRDWLGHAPVEPALEQLFAAGIDPAPGGGPSDTPADWPSGRQTAEFCARARLQVDEAVARAPLTGWMEKGWLPRMLVEHRLMHAETICYMLQRMDLALKRPGPIPSAAALAGTPAEPGVVRIARGPAVLGLSRAEAPVEGWDNEYQRHSALVPAFELSRLPVSNGDWLHFIDSGGYREPSLWTGPDRAWLAREGITHPASWVQRSGRWSLRTMFGEVPLPGALPVYVSHAEASAYARWKGARLPTEAEWHRAAYGSGPAAVSGGHYGWRSFDPAPIGSAEGSHTLSGAVDLVGNGWEWTSTPFAPFAGFTPMPFYPVYSANFFDGNHFVLKGASAVTDAAFLRPSFRNWFQPHYQHVFAKFRLAFAAGEGAA